MFEPVGEISIHAPREGCDQSYIETLDQMRISIHAPREGCDWSMVPFTIPQRISIHAPREGCDTDGSMFEPVGEISIHAPREGCDLGGFTTGLECGNFNPRTPRGVRLCMLFFPIVLLIFQSTHPARGATLQNGKFDTLFIISIHAPREGCD